MGTFGETLRQARDDLGVSIQDAERETRISRRYLEALEREDGTGLPAAVYTRGFIRTYSQYLGLDPETMLDQYGPQALLDDRVDIKPIPADNAGSRPLPIRPAVILAGVLAAGLLIVYLWGQYNSFLDNIDRLDTQPTSRAPNATLTPGRTPSPSPTPPVAAAPGIPLLGSTPVPSPSPVVPERGLVVDARVVERTWMEVWVDGRSVMAETAQVGFQRSFTGDSQVRMRVGNAAGVQIVVNGSSQGPLGVRGQAVDAVWGRQ